MSPDKLLAVFHFCNGYHSGQWSREYRLLCRVMRVFVPARSEVYLEILDQPGYETAREYYQQLLVSTGNA